MEMPHESLKQIFDYIEKNRTQYIQNLAIVVAKPSVSAFKENRSDVIDMMIWMQDELLKLNASVELCEIGNQKFTDGSEIPLPPVILGQLGNDVAKPTLLVYGHLDVQPASISDGWNTEPFKLTTIDGKLYGRGSTDDKGPAISWLHVVQAYRDTNIPLPVNLKFCYEGMEECSSEGLEKLLHSKKDTFLKDIDYVCISDNYWLGETKPCLTYGLRGMCIFHLEITCASQDLHSGIFGGTINEAMTDLIAMLNTLVDTNAKILIPSIMDDVKTLDEEEKKLYKNIDFHVEDFRRLVGTEKLIHDCKENVLMARWRYPSLSIHGIEGAFSESGFKSVIPQKVIGKFSIRLVPNQDPNKINQLVTKHIETKWKERGSTNKMKLYTCEGAPAWTTSPSHPHIEAAKKAIQQVFNVDPDLIREGGSIPITLTFQEITGKNVLLLPMGSCDDGAHSQNEKINEVNYIEGTKVMAAYIYEVGKLGKDKN